MKALIAHQVYAVPIRLITPRISAPVLHRRSISRGPKTGTMAAPRSPPSFAIVLELMQEFVQRQQEAREYDHFLRHKIEISRGSMRAGLGRSNEQVEADFTARHAESTGKA